MNKIFHGSEVGLTNHTLVEIILYNNQLTENVVVDRATAARLINQLRRVLDKED